MRNRLFLVIASAALLLSSALAHADSFSFSFATTPADGAISGAAGATIGWGYTISNLDPDHWLLPTALNSDLFQLASPNAFLFDFPALAPGATISESYSPGLAGLFELTWDPTAPAGFTNAGTFILSADFYDGDPFAGGNFLLSGSDQIAPYTATVTASPVTDVPEPSTTTMLIFGVTLILWRARAGRRRALPMATTASVGI